MQKEPAEGEKRVDIDVPGSNLTDREKLLNRIGDYLKKILRERNSKPVHEPV